MKVRRLLDCALKYPPLQARAVTSLESTQFSRDVQWLLKSTAERLQLLLRRALIRNRSGPDDPGLICCLDWGDSTRSAGVWIDVIWHCTHVLVPSRMGSIHSDALQRSIGTCHYSFTKLFLLNVGCGCFAVEFLIYKKTVEATKSFDKICSLLWVFYRNYFVYD